MEGQPRTSQLSGASRIPGPRSSQLKPPTSRFGYTGATSSSLPNGIARTNSQQEVLQKENSYPPSSLNTSSNVTAEKSVTSGKLDIRSLAASVFASADAVSKSLNFENGIPKQPQDQTTTLAGDLQSAKRPSNMSDIRKMVRTTDNNPTPTTAIPASYNNNIPTNNNPSEKIVPSATEPMLRPPSRNEDLSFSSTGSSFSDRAITPSKLSSLELMVKRAIQTSNDAIVEPHDSLSGSLKSPLRSLPSPPNEVNNAASTNILAIPAAASSVRISLHDRFAKVAVNGENIASGSSALSSSSTSGGGRFDVTSTVNAYSLTSGSSNSNSNNTSSVSTAPTSTAASSSAVSSSSRITPQSVIPPSNPVTNPAIASTIPTNTTSSFTTNTSNSLATAKLSSEELITIIHSALQVQQEYLTATSSKSINTIQLHKLEEDHVFQSFCSASMIPLSTGREEELFPGVPMSSYLAYLANQDMLTTPNVQQMISQMITQYPSSTRKLLSDEEYDEVDKLLLR